ncbi:MULTISPECIES: DUF2934 domain-containing protein [unclassified Shinella]|uniref:DUF2934 domain-containing protein n=1 Tax=unclassified Shinella TaxID=2643062 RepID=UPI00225D77A7|nr:MULTISPECIES: DUF2934 domain-containing protein [unclassified Shinella]MCO5136007.1 DUF2934 domain-containing protein [Shinella sp.]MDC7254356.1 DUF2934 domain-containing protein [Shinella sp. YE25]CAI0337044.1 conserved hypothetical protein [Rhizobiaceae bacterium]CAK7255568.1 DUF2934 domain-containing protein [Shinella sp. WSC3-e]
MDDERERRIKARAFELWQREGSLDGRSLGHWLQAEREIQEEDEAEAARRDVVGLAAAANPTH